jgi:nicotinamide-nucleotide amidase
VTEVNRKQAEIPENCIRINNSNGTAPGMWFEEGVSLDNGKKHVYISMPGVPFEMKTMMINEIIPRIKQYFQPVTVIHHTILTQGLGESFLSDLLGRLGNPLTGEAFIWPIFHSPVSSDSDFQARDRMKLNFTVRWMKKLLS